MDNEFLELYGGLQSHHEEKRQQHFMESAAELQSKTTSSNSISAAAVSTGNTSPNTTTTTQGNITLSSNETTPPPSDSIVGIEPMEIKTTEEEVGVRLSKPREKPWKLVQIIKYLIVLYLVYNKCLNQFCTS